MLRDDTPRGHLRAVGRNFGIPQSGQGAAHVFRAEHLVDGSQRAKGRLADGATLRLAGKLRLPTFSVVGVVVQEIPCRALVAIASVND